MNEEQKNELKESLKNLSEEEKNELKSELKKLKEAVATEEGRNSLLENARTEAQEKLKAEAAKQNLTLKELKKKNQDHARDQLMADPEFMKGYLDFARQLQKNKEREQKGTAD